MYKDPAPSQNTEDKLTTWANEPTLSNLKEDFESSKPHHDAQILKIKHWDSLLNVTGTSKPAKVIGRSSVQPKLIRRQAEWRYSALTEPFLSSQKLYKVSPITFEDGDSATQNELVLNHQFRTKLNKVKLIDDFVRATVDEGTSIIRLGWKRSTKEVMIDAPVWEHYEIQDKESADALQQALALKDEDPSEYANLDPAIHASVDMYIETGQATSAVQKGTQKVKSIVVLENKPTVEVLNPENVYIDPSCNGDIDKALFIAVSFETNKADLIKEGKYKNLDKVDWEGSSPVTQPNHATGIPNDFTLKDPLRKRVVAYEYWGYWDIKGNDELVPIVSTWIGNTKIRMEEAPFPDEKLPFVLVPYLPVKRGLYGEPDAELLEDNQRILGAVSRGMIDLMGRSANSQQGFAKGMLDPLNRRRYEKGQDYEFNPNVNPANGIITHKYPEIPQSAMLMLNLQTSEAESLSGVKGFGDGITGKSYGDVAAGVRGALDAASKREMAILRRLAKGMMDIGNKIIAMNAVFLSEEEVVRVTNEKFVTIKREDLKGNFDLEVDIATAEVDNAKAQDLGFMLQTIGPGMDSGISMMILSEIASLKRMPKLAHDLKNWKPEPDPLAEQLKQIELQKAQKEVELLDSEIMLNNARAQREGADAQRQGLNTIEQQSGTAHTREVEKQKAQAKANQELEITKALTKPIKSDQQEPDIEAAIGYNQLSGIMDGSRDNIVNSNSQL